MKNKTKIALVLGTASIFALSGCQEDKVVITTFKDLPSCIANPPKGDVNFSGSADKWKEICEKQYKTAMEANAKSSPRYVGEGANEDEINIDGRKLCEEQHGVGQCDSRVDSSGNSYFSPFMAGYLMSGIFNQSSNSYIYSSNYVSQPLYHSSKTGGYMNSTGSLTTKNIGSNKWEKKSGRNLNTTLRPTKIKTWTKPSTRTSIRSSGGFGKARTSFSSRGGFGG